MFPKRKNKSEERWSGYLLFNLIRAFGWFILFHQNCLFETQNQPNNADFLVRRLTFMCRVSFRYRKCDKIRKKGKNSIASVMP